MRHITRGGRAIFTILLSAFLGLAAVSLAEAQSDLKWQLSEGNDPDSGGRKVARLVYGVPETDNQQVVGVCEARSGTSAAFSAVRLSADTGKLGNGAEVKLRFSGGGREIETRGEIVGVGNTQEAISGILIRPRHDDPVWTMLTQLDAVDYTIPGYRTRALALKDGRTAINDFVAACKSYARAAASPPSDSNAGITEKEAFEIAKDLGTADGWRAFLKQFSTGFRADLARAYINRLANKTTDGARPQRAPTTTPRIKPSLPTVARGPATSRWINRTERRREGSVYTASVRVPGVELTTYCVRRGSGNYGLGAVLRQKGRYPEFGERIRQGLAASSALDGGPNRAIDIEFSNGARVADAAALPSLVNRELGIGPNADAFEQGSAALEYLMSQSEVTIALAPFEATFQLRGSRKAICSVMDRCGARVAGCGRRGPAIAQPVRSPRRCTGGRIFKRASGQCVCPVSRSYWNGRSCERLRCGKNYRLVRGECVLQQNCGRNAYRSPEGDCYCVRGYRRTSGGTCVRRRRSEGQDGPIKCGRGRTWVGGQGRCVCLDDRKRWNGRRCVTVRRGCGPGKIRNSRGRCVAANRNCGPGAFYVPDRGRCFCSDGSKRYRNGRCISKRRRPSCTGGRVYDNQVNRCVCNGDSAWNGRACVKENEPPRRPVRNSNKQNACNLLRAACQFGAQPACRKFQRDGC
ncbi:MAG: hypothetical protein ACR2PI_01795 [Hyphomicrobiaceae bacterium]